MSSRYEDALLSQSAVNPSGLANTLVRWQREIIEAGGSTDDVRQDPACRLLVYQMAHLMGVDSLYTAEYTELYLKCEQMAHGQPH